MIITHVQRISFLFVAFFGFVFAQERASSSEEVFGEYCFAKVKSKEGTVWKWDKYKGDLSYLFSYVPCAYKYKYSFFSDEGVINGELFGQMLENSNYNEKRTSKCLKDHFDAREYVSLDELRESTAVEQSKLAKIKNTYYNLDWEVTYDSNYVRIHHSGATKIYIFGFCTEEQLKAIGERRKNEMKSND